LNPRSRSLAIFWLVAGTMHFVVPKYYQDIVPPPLDKRKQEIVAISGVAELLGGLLVISERTRGLARWYLLALLAAVYPANVHMALNAERFKQVPAPALWARLPVQFLFAWHAWRGTAA
jgi:uncharacterized membrane protein